MRPPKQTQLAWNLLPSDLQLPNLDALPDPVGVKPYLSMESDDTMGYLFFNLTSALLYSELRIKHIDPKRLASWLQQLSPDEFQFIKRSARYDGHDERPLQNYFMYLHWRNVGIVRICTLINNDAVKVVYDPACEAQVMEWAQQVPRTKPPKAQQHFLHLIENTSMQLSLRQEPIRNIRMNLAQHYAPDFVGQVPKLLQTARNPQRNGLILLHGMPGTGKTTFIRYLISKISRFRKVIYLPVHLAHNLSDPQFLPFLLEHSGSILVIEDAEGILRPDPDGQRSPALANLLNIGDGLLGDFLRIQILCTFNQPIQSLDPALTRQGRLLFAHEFKTLPAAQANRLARKLKLAAQFDQPTTLAQIYHLSGQAPPSLVPNKRQIGFQTDEDSSAPF